MACDAGLQNETALIWEDAGCVGTERVGARGGRPVMGRSCIDPDGWGRGGLRGRGRDDGVTSVTSTLFFVHNYSKIFHLQI